MVLWGSLCICLASAITVFWVWLTPDGGPLMLFAPQFITALGNGLLVPNAIAGAISVRPQAAGTASGITGFLQMAVGGAGAQAIAHVLAGAHNAMPLVIMVACFAALCLLSWLCLSGRA